MPTDNSLLTIVQAADLLNVSPQFVETLIDEQKVSFVAIGSERRVPFSEVIAFQQCSRERRRKILKKLTEEAQQLGLGYNNERSFEDRLDWDFAIIDPPPRPSGQIQVKLNYIGRGKPIPVDFPDDEAAATGS